MKSPCRPSILITAGGTSERIDDVRRIANSGTGRLGALVADAFAKEAPQCGIVYLCSEGAVRPSSADADVRVCDDVSALLRGVREACAQTRFDIIVHSMAVSDYRVRAVTDAGLLAGALAGLPGARDGDLGPASSEALRAAVMDPPRIDASKISSDKESLVVVLERAPKVIAELRGLAPDAVIVGFKLLSGVSEQELVSAGLSLLNRNRCDYVFANDMKSIGADSHEGLLIDAGGACERAHGKPAIAELIARRTLCAAAKRADGMAALDAADAGRPSAAGIPAAPTAQPA